MYTDIEKRFAAEMAASIDLEIMKKMVDMLNKHIEDKFLRELDLVKKMLPLMKRAEDALSENESVKVTSEDGLFSIDYQKDKVIRFIYHHQMKSSSSSVSFTAAELHFQDINSSNNVHEDVFYFSPVNTNFTIDEFDFSLDENNEVDEAWYFQKLTQSEQAPIEYYNEVSEIVKSIWKGNFVALEVRMESIIGDGHIEAYKGLLELINA